MSNKVLNPSNSQQMQSDSTDDEIMLKDFITQLKSWIKLFLANFKKIIFVGLLGGLIGFTYAYFSKPVYTAKLTFVLRADAGSVATTSLSGLTSLLGVGASAAPTDRVMELLGSQRIIGEALLSPIIINEKRDLLINHFIQLKNLDKNWENDTLLSKVKFKIGDSFSDLTQGQRLVIKSITDQIAGLKGIVTKSFDKKSGVITLTAVDIDEQLSIELTKIIYSVLVNFYTDESVSSITNKVKTLQQKVDSIQTALTITQRALAASNDQGLGLLFQKDKVNQKKLSLEESVLTLMYGEALKNLEQLNFILASTSPSFSIIDQPYSPIIPKRKSKILFAVGFSILFVFLYFLLLLGKAKFVKLLN